MATLKSEASNNATIHRRNHLVRTSIHIMMKPICCTVILFYLSPTGFAFVNYATDNFPGNRNVVLFSEPRPSSGDLQAEAERLLARAREIRSQIPIENSVPTTKTPSPSIQRESPWGCAVASTDEPGLDYRLYVDIGREQGTWMDPRWGASGRRIEFTLDVRFLDTSATNAQRKKLASNNNLQRSSSVQVLRTAEYARLRSGFDRMKCYGGVHSLDKASTSSSQLTSSTMRFMVEVEGTDGYGDVTIPAGCLYFCIPCFANNIGLLSSKDGTVTIRQMGWNTGWRREESRIVGTFRAIPLEKARQRDGF